MKAIFKKILVIIFGCFLCALGVSYFVTPAGLLAAGCTGIGIVLNHYTGLSVSVGLWAASIVFFLWGVLALGTEFALTTLVGTISYPLSYNVTSWLVARTGPVTDDIFLCMVFAGICFGVGVGMIMRIGASTGASDVPALILYRKFGIPISVTLNVIDGLILCLQMPFTEPRRILYGLLYVLVYSVLIGKVVLFGQDKIQIQIHSAMYEQINQIILQDLKHGSTLFHIQGGYGRQETFAIQTVVTKRELFRVREAALKIDPQAFLVINPVSDVNGRGFTLSRDYEPAPN